MPAVNLSTLTTTLQENERVFSQIFRARLAKLDDLRSDFIVMNLEADKKTKLVRSFLGNITQPGLTGNTNFTNDAIRFIDKDATNKRIKIDLRFTEQEREALRTSFLSKFFGTSDSDLYTVTGADYIFSELMAKAEQEMYSCLYGGVYNGGTGTVGGANLFDGLGTLFNAAYASQEIPGVNKAIGAAAAITPANFVAELTKFEDVIITNQELLTAADVEGGTVYLPRAWKIAIQRGLDNLTFKTANVVELNPDKTLSFTKFPNIVVKTPFWMNGVNNMFYTAPGNLFFLTHTLQMNNVQVEFQKQDRDLKFFADWYGGVNFADGRYIALHR